MEITNSKPQQGESYGWEQEYHSYLAEKYAAEQLDCPSSKKTSMKKDDASNQAEDEPWYVQYAAYCVEKESRLAKEDARRLEEQK